MNKEEKNVYEAKQCMKSHIKFFDLVLKHLSGSNEQLKWSAMWTTWCLHRYINDNLIKDIQKAMLSQQASNDPD